jgi:hypothetical protein
MRRLNGRGERGAGWCVLRRLVTGVEAEILSLAMSGVSVEVPIALDLVAGRRGDHEERLKARKIFLSPTVAKRLHPATTAEGGGVRPAHYRSGAVAQPQR